MRGRGAGRQVSVASFREARDILDAVYASGQERPLLGFQPVEPGDEKRLDRGRKHRVVAVLLGGERQELLEEERIALGRLGDPEAVGRRERP